MLLERVAHALGEPARGRQIAVGQHHAELVASQARDEVPVAQRELQDQRRLRQHLVPDLFPEALVDCGEVVEVERDDGERQARLLGAAHLLHQPVMERARVCEAGHLVAAGLPAELVQLEPGAQRGAQGARGRAHQGSLLGPPALSAARQQVERADALVPAEQRHAHRLAQVPGLVLPRPAGTQRVERSVGRAHVQRRALAVERREQRVERALERFRVGRRGEQRLARVPQASGRCAAVAEPRRAAARAVVALALARPASLLGSPPATPHESAERAHRGPP